MCSCTSCELTDSFAGKSFADWPRGNPAGQRSSEASYRAHVAHSFHGAKKRIDFGPKGAGFYGGGKLAERVLEATFANGIQPTAWDQEHPDEPEKQTPAAKPALARPATLSKAPQHFPAPDRSSGGTVLVYGMPKLSYATVAQTAKRWGCSPERIYQWLLAERIPGAIKPARDWLIPDKAARPAAEVPYAFTERKKKAA